MTEEKKTKIIGVRVAEWFEWLPMFPDGAVNNELPATQGATFIQIDAAERLMEIESAPVGPTITRRVVDGSDGPKVLEEGADDEDDEKKAFELMFSLWKFKATVASNIDQDAVPEPLVTSGIPKAPPQIQRALAIPDEDAMNRAARRKGARR